MADPQVHYIDYPLPPRVKCSKCFGAEGAGKVKGEYSDPPHLAKHLKKCHPGDTLNYKCSICNLRGTGKYPLRDIKAHYAECHASPAVDAAGPSARGSLGECSGAGQPTASRAAKATTRLAETVGGADKRRAVGSRQLTLPFATTPSPSTAAGEAGAQRNESTTSTSRSPSYAAVTAGPSIRSTTTSTTARSKTAAKSAAPNITTTTARRSGEAAATRKPPTTATVSKPRVLSVETVRLPVGDIHRAGVQNAAKPARAPSRPPQRTSPEAGGPRTSGAKERCGEGAYRKLPASTNSTSARTRRATSVPVEKSEGTARRERVSPHPPPKGIDILISSTSEEEGTPYQPGGVGRLRLRRRKVTGPPPKTTPEEGVVTRARRSTSAPVEKSALNARLTALDRPSSRATGNPTSQNAGGRYTNRGQSERTPPARLPSLSPTIRGSPSGSLGETRTSVSPATSLPATLTTCTVTTTTCGSPITSTGFTGGVGRLTTPPSLPQTSILPTIGEEETSPCVAVATPPIRGGRSTSPLIPPGPSTPEPERGPEERRLEGAAQPPTTPVVEGDQQWGGQWTVSVRRRARRQQIHDTSPSNSESPPTAGPSRSPRLAPLSALIAASTNRHENSLNLNNTYSNICIDRTPPRNVLPIGAERRRETSPRDRVEGDSGHGAGKVSAEHPNAPVNVRGVMSRGRATASSIVPPRADRGEGGRQHHGRRRLDAPVGQPSRDHPAPAAVARQRRRERGTARDALLDRAKDVASIADLEAFAASVAAFFGEDASATGAAARARDRSVRSREAGARRGVRGSERPGREGASGPGSAPADPGASGEARGDWVREAKRLQALYRANRRRAVREVLQGPADQCQVPKRQVQEYFERLYSGGEDLAGAGVEAERPDPSSPREVSAVLGPLAEREVDRRLRRMNNSAPGPDGVSYRDLRGADRGARLLTALYNICLRLEAVPASWKTSNTVLIHKKGDRGMLENWRPLALGDTVPKLFAALLADRLTDWAVTHGKLCSAQKGFLRDEGCYEHNFVLQEVLTHAKRTKRQAVVAWLDLSNAFGSIPHATIRRALIRSAVPRGLIAIWDSMYDGCTTRVRTAEGHTAPIPIRSGVRQGCPLSPIVFNLAIDSVVRVAAEADDGYSLHGNTWSALAYADDVALLAQTPEGMGRMLASVEAEAASVGLRFNPAKCATLHIGAGNGGRVLPTPFQIQGETINPLAQGESYTHLGVPTGFSVDQTPYAAVGDIVSDLRAVDRSLLAPWQKIEALGTFILPRLDFLLRGARVFKGPLTAVDLNIRRSVKSWLNLPQRASAEGVYMPPRWGGCGLLPLSDLADVLTVAHAYRMLTVRDGAVRELAWESLRGVVGRRIGHAPGCEDIASFLSGSLDGRMRGGGEASLWSSVRNAALRQSERLSLRWRWVEATEEMTLECRGPRGAAVKIPPGARDQVVGRLRSAVAEHYANRLLSKPDQGKVFEVSSRSRVSNHFIRGGSFTRFADWRFIHKARLDVLPLNGARRWEANDKRCRRCGEVSETLPHVLCHCGIHSAAIQLRHDAVLHRLWKATRLPGVVRVNQRVEGVSDELGALRPDLVIRHEPSKSVVICDVTVPFENRWTAFEDARARKIAKYSPLAEELQRRGYRVVVTAFVVGALGSWDPRNEAVLRLLRVGSQYATMMRRLIVSDTIRWSRDIYVEHVSGIRQYLAPSRPRGDHLATPPRAVRRRWLAEERGAQDAARRGPDCVSVA